MNFKPLQDGTLIRIVQPAYRLSDDLVDELRCMLEPRGLLVDSLGLAPGYGKLSADDNARATELLSAVTDPRVGAILIGHGGYGCMRLMGQLDWHAFAEHPKPIIGFSDATALLVPLASVIGPNTIHGPNARSLIRHAGTATFEALVAILHGDWITYNDLLSLQSERVKVLRPGRVSGRLIGGNLSVLAALCGTPFGIDTKDAILFLEDWNEPQYRFDRMLTQLKLSGALDQITALVMGNLVDIARVGEDIPEDIAERVAALVPAQVPILFDFPAGHGPSNFPLLLGGRYEIDDALVALAP